MQASAQRERHPVWVVYDRLRTARLNVKYYGCRLYAVERLNFWLELILLVSAPSSAVAGLAFWDHQYGQWVWQCLGVIAAFVSVVKPLLGLPKRIKSYEKLLSGYRTLDYDLIEIKGNVEQRRKYDSTMQAEYKRAIQREKVLVNETPDAKEDLVLKKKCQDEVLREMPVESFYVPEDDEK